MFATLQQDLQRKHNWITELRPHPDDVAAIEAKDAEQGTPADTVSGDTRLRLQVVVKAYKLRRNTALLDELGEWARTKGLAIEAHILTEKESQQLEILGADEAPNPHALMQFFRDQTTYPDNARRQLERALSELRRILRNLEQEFPTSGLHAWNVGLHLQSTYQHIMSWGLALFDQESQGTPDDWDQFLSHYRTYHPALNQPGCQQYPMQLQAFLTRQEQLTSLVPKSYDDNDLELEQLLLPLENAVRAIHSCAQQKLTRPEVIERRTSRIWWLTMTMAILGSCGLLALHFSTLPTQYAAVKLPAKAKKGGIEGRYYKGRNFGKLLGKRNDKSLDMLWKGSPMRGVPANHFSVEWKGYIFANRTGLHKICSRHDDGARLFLHNKRLINSWRVGWARTRCKKVKLEKGWHPIRVQLFEKGKLAEIHLKLKRPGDAKALPIPSKHYCCKK